MPFRQLVLDTVTTHPKSTTLRNNDDDKRFKLKDREKKVNNERDRQTDRQTDRDRDRDRQTERSSVHLVHWATPDRCSKGLVD